MDDENLLIPGAEEEDNGENGGNREAHGSDESTQETTNIIWKIGITQIVLGTVSIIVSIIMTVSWTTRIERNTSPGIWCGLFALIAGGLAIALKFFMTGPMVITSLVFSITASVFGLTLTILGYFSALFMASPNMVNALVPGYAGLLALSWTGLCVYQSIVLTRILVQNRKTACSCCMQKSYPSYPGMTMAYMPNKSSTPAVYVSVPADSATLPHHV